MADPDEMHEELKKQGYFSHDRMSPETRERINELDDKLSKRLEDLSAEVKGLRLDVNAKVSITSAISGIKVLVGVMTAVWGLGGTLLWLTYSETKEVNKVVSEIRSDMSATVVIVEQHAKEIESLKDKQASIIDQLKEWKIVK